MTTFPGGCQGRPTMVSVANGRQRTSQGAADSQGIRMCIGVKRSLQILRESSSLQLHIEVLFGQQSSIHPTWGCILLLLLSSLRKRLRPPCYLRSKSYGEKSTYDVDRPTCFLFFLNQMDPSLSMVSAIFLCAVHRGIVSFPLLFNYTQSIAEQ